MSWAPSRRAPRRSCSTATAFSRASSRGSSGPSLLAEPERVGLVEPDIAARIPRPVAFLRHVAQLLADRQRLAHRVHRADREDLLGVNRQDLVPCLAARG